MKIIFFKVIIISFILFGCQPEKDSIKIGAILPLTENTALLGEMTKNGLQLAVDEINSNGGLLDKKIQLVVEDSKGEPKVGLQMLKSIESFHDPVMYYSIVSGVAMSVKPQTENNQKVYMSAVGATDYLENSKFTIRNYFSAEDIAEAIVKVFSDSLSGKKLGIYYANTEYARSINESILKFSKKSGTEVVFNSTYDAERIDNKEVILKNSNKYVDAIYVVGVGKSLGQVMNDIYLYSDNKSLSILADPLFNSPDVKSQITYANANIFFLDFDIDPNSLFHNSFKERYNVQPDNFAALAYLGMKTFHKACVETKSLKSEKIIKFFQQSSFESEEFGNVQLLNRQFKFQFKVNKYVGS